MRIPLKDLAGRRFDVAIIGAGANGSSAAQHLAAEGYDVLLVDKGDFASGSSSRSSRLLHCGLRYLAPGGSVWNFVRHPKRFTTACRMAKAAMSCRAQFVKTTPERVRALQFGFPIYADGAYAGWQIDAAFALLRALGPKDVPLDYRRISQSEAASLPLLQHLRDRRSLRGVAMFREYQFDWPERIVVDTVLDAERLGATVRNYTPVTRIARTAERWAIELADALDASVTPVTVSAEAILNMAGIWIDQVNQRVDKSRARRRITGTKGIHIAVRLPPECQGYGIVTFNRKGEPLYCVPWRGLHYFGPTETLYEGDLDDVRPTEDEVEGLIAEANHLLPTLPFKRQDVLYAWAGVRPLTYDPNLPMGARSRELHDLSGEGLPNVFAMTAGPIMSHRSAGPETVRALRSKLRPGRPRQQPSYAARPLPIDPDSPALLNQESAVRLADVRHAAASEYAETLVDALFRRTGAGWSETMAREAAPIAARMMAEVLGWPQDRVDIEVKRYLEHLHVQHLVPAAAP
jgi:glycerol-3-phosphate dehydrogenase